MAHIARSFVSLALWCWAICFALVLCIILVLGNRGEPVIWWSVSTWLALLYGALVSAVAALPPAMFLAALFAAARYWNSGEHRALTHHCCTGRPTAAGGFKR